MLKATVIGNLAADAETKAFKNGKQYIALTVAHDNGKDKSATWVRVSWAAGVGHPVLPSLRKGAKVAVTGDLKVDAWTDRQGQLQAGIDVFADSVDIVLFAKREGDQQAPRQAAPSQGAPTQAAPAGPAPYGAQPGGYPGYPAGARQAPDYGAQPGGYRAAPAGPDEAF